MKIVIFIIFFLFSNCSIDKDSNLRTNNFFKNDRNVINTLNNKNKVSYSTEMTFEEFNLYIEDYIKKSKYPDINQ
jgi:hypothetical protein